MSNSNVVPSRLSPDLQKQRYLTEREVAALIGKAVQSLRNDRHRGCGLPYRKIGGAVRYSLPEILSIIENNRIDPEAL